VKSNLKHEFNVGDVVEGLYSHKGKTGVIVDESYSFWVKLQWEGAKRPSSVETSKIKLKEIN
jgi:hypothetical protein